MRNIKATFITLLLAFAVIFSCFPGYGNELYDLAKLANDGFTFASIMIFDGTNHYVVITDGNDYLKVIPLTDYIGAGDIGMTINDTGRLHIFNSTNKIYTYEMDGTHSVSDLFTKVYSIAADHDKVYALVDKLSVFYIYQYNEDTDQWTDTGTNLTSIGTFLSYCLVRDNATGSVYLAGLNDPTTTFYRVPGLDILGNTSGDNTSFYSVYSNEGFTFSSFPTHGLCSTQRGTLATPATSYAFTAMDSDNIFWGNGAGLIYRYNSTNGLTSKTVTLPNAPNARIIPLDGSRIIVSEYNAATCDIFLYNYDTGEVIKTLYSYATSGVGAVYDSVYR